MNKLVKKAFTLIELLVVIAIIGILLAVSLASYITAQKQVRDARRKTDLLQLQQALESFRSEKGYYPDNSTWTTDLAPTYINTIPQDPKLSGYKYIGSGVSHNSTYSLCTSLEIIPATISLNKCNPVEGYNYEVTSP